MMALMLVGWNVSVNTQQYHDSTRSFATFLQQQYTGVTDVVNDRKATYNCSVDMANQKTTVIDVAGSTPHGVGQTDCVLLGKYIYIGQGKAVVYPVLGSEKPNSVAGTSDISQTFTQTAATVADPTFVAPTEYNIPWSPRLTSSVDTTTNNIEIIIAILRSPDTGMVHTKWRVTSGGQPAADALPTLFTTDAAIKTQDISLCFHPDNVVTGEAQAVKIGEDASSANAVQVLTSGSGCTL